jgi:regulator of cell morphogenesis and NO signaling
VICATCHVAGDGPAEWALMGVSQLVDHLEATHHRYPWDELPHIAGLVDKVVSAHAERHAELYAVADTFHVLHAELVPHLQREETVLFPMIRGLATADELPSFHCGSIADPISVMLSDTTRPASCSSRCAKSPTATRPPDDGCPTYWTLYDAMSELDTDTHLHIHKENNLLFPAVTSVERRLVVG